MYHFDKQTNVTLFGFAVVFHYVFTFHNSSLTIADGNMCSLEFNVECKSLCYCNDLVNLQM